MPVEEARTFLQRVPEKIASSDIEVAHRDVLIRLRSIIEEDLEAGATPTPDYSVSDSDRSNDDASRASPGTEHSPVAIPAERS
jgi:hypothetical protein